ncbi:hypothetical protein [Streptomyces sp. E5N91]|uniref:hypothetical protein n=1 Tax=Streptomyces sp. E5N91 TaxID=1851996 RepID=UPI00187D1166|nr:hypothetical protein [Streptomyces sp. E5N91]
MSDLLTAPPGTVTHTLDAGGIGSEQTPWTARFRSPADIRTAWIVALARATSTE